LFGPANIERTLLSLPETVRILDISGTDITRLPDNLPKGLVELIARNCKNLQSIATLPASLVVLDVRGCKNLVHVPERLPLSLEELYLEATAITRLPKLPANVRVVDARSCHNLIVTSAEWPLFTGYGGKFHWLDLSKTPVVHWIYGNLPASVVKQLREHGCAGYRTDQHRGTIQLAGQQPVRMYKYQS
jgi:hypothetical protein